MASMSSWICSRNGNIIDFRQWDDKAYNCYFSLGLSEKEILFTGHHLANFCDYGSALIFCHIGSIIVHLKLQRTTNMIGGLGIIYGWMTIIEFYDFRRHNEKLTDWQKVGF